MIDFLTLFGLIGIALVVSVGKVFDPLRGWLTSFEVPVNPLRILGEMISCTMCTGWWAGLLWSLSQGDRFSESVIVAGIVSFGTYTADELMALLSAMTIHVVRRNQTPPAGEGRRKVQIPKAPRTGEMTEQDAEEEADADWTKG